MNWTIKFIGEEQFKTHVAKTIAEYGDNLQPYDIKKSFRTVFKLKKTRL